MSATAAATHPRSNDLRPAAPTRPSPARADAPPPAAPEHRRPWLAPELTRFLAYVWRYKALLAWSIVAGVFKFVLAFGFPVLTGLVLGRVVIGHDGTGAAMTPYDRGTWLWATALASVALLVSYAVATFFRDYLTGKLGFRVIADLRQDLFDHLHRLSLHFYSKERTGSIVSRVIGDISQASNLVNGGVITVVMDMVAMLMGAGILFYLNWKLALLALAVLPLNAVFLRFLSPRVKQAGVLVQRSIGRLSGTVQERLAGIALVQTSAAEGRESRRFKVDVEEHYDRVLQQRALSAMVSTAGEFLTKSGTLAVFVFGGYLALRGGLTAEALTIFAGSLAMMYTPIQRFSEVNVVYQTCMASLERIFRVFDITPKILEKPDAYPHPVGRGEVEFDRVRFSYSDDSDESRVRLRSEDDDEDPLDGGDRRDMTRDVDPDAFTQKERRQRVRRELSRQLKVDERKKRAQRRGELPEAREPATRRWVLDGLSFKVDAGERVALVGPSGSGKTTLVSLLPRLYDVSEGAIRIDGRDLRDFKKQPLRQSIGIVQQDSFLFSGSIRENLRYGRPGATDAEIVDAAKAANAHGFITEQEHGYDTPLGERGVNLSGGQRQRLSIARAILKDPRILILDEATSALDVESERLVQQALERLMKGRTCFIIAHRLSTIRNADRIFVIDRGRCVEEGTHDSLVADGGLYARLARQAFGQPVAEAA